MEGKFFQQTTKWKTRTQTHEKIKGSRKPPRTFLASKTRSGSSTERKPIKQKHEPSKKILEPTGMIILDTNAKRMLTTMPFFTRNTYFAKLCANYAYAIPQPRTKRCKMLVTSRVWELLNEHKAESCKMKARQFESCKMKLTFWNNMKNMSWR